MVRHASPGDLALAAILLAIIAYTCGLLIKRISWDNRK
jgi:hypothetical protein